MENDFTYYRILNTIDENIPRLNEHAGGMYFYEDQKIENPELMDFSFSDPAPRHPKMVDFLDSSNVVLSRKIYDVLMPLNIKTINFLSAEIEDNKGVRHKNYFGVQFLKIINCVDLNLSECTYSDWAFINIKKMILNKEILRVIPLEERLVFQLGEAPWQLFHHSIVEKINAVNPTGIRWIRFEDMHDRVFYE